MLRIPLLALFRQRRPLDIEQVSGFMLIAGAAALYTSPITSSLLWLGALWGVTYLPVLFVALYFVCGVALCLLTRSNALVYALLTAPILLYGALLLSYLVGNHIGIFAAGSFGAFWVFMQWTHSIVQEVRLWMTHSDS